MDSWRDEEPQRLSNIAKGYMLGSYSCAMLLIVIKGIYYAWGRMQDTLTSPLSEHTTGHHLLHLSADLHFYMNRLPRATVNPAPLLTWVRAVGVLSAAGWNLSGVLGRGGASKQSCYAPLRAVACGWFGCVCVCVSVVWVCVCLYLLYRCVCLSLLYGCVFLCLLFRCVCLCLFFRCVCLCLCVRDYLQVRVIFSVSFCEVEW